MKNLRSFFEAVACLAAIFVLLLGNSARISAQDQFDYQTERKRAFQLIEENKIPDALPILEKLMAAKPDDAPVIERLALALVINASASRRAPEEIKKDLTRAHSLAQKSIDLGHNTSLVQMIIERIPADGSAGLLTEQKKRTPAEETLFEGESAFAQGEMERAILLYERAAKLDPKMYEAPLFIGDAYYKMKKIDKAGEAYTRAIALNPDRETAYRYWGNVLMSEGRMQESREKFIEAIIAEPYNRSPWQFMLAWARRNQMELGHPRIDIPTSSVVRKDDQNINVLINPTERKDGSEAWTVYSIVRASWMTEKKFVEAFPNEKAYRHSLREETQALRMTAETVTTQINEGKLKESSLDVSIVNLLKLNKAGLIEPYVLLAIPDDGIARDYEEYRKNNRDKLRLYLNEYVIAKD
jgi:tetratricopeptide (TPR) repeat protein